MVIMDQAELRRQLRQQLDETQRDMARLTSLRKPMQYEWAEEEARLKAKVTEINRQLHETRRLVTFPEMFQKVAEARLDLDFISSPTFCASAVTGGCAGLDA